MGYKVVDQNGLNFITMTIVDWIDLFTRPIYAEIVIDSLRFCQKEKGLSIYGYVIMPSHLHLLVQTDSPKGLSTIIKEFKTFTTNQFIKYIQEFSNIESRRTWLLNQFRFHARKNKTNSDHQIWQSGSHPIILYTPRIIQGKLNYIHQNPVESKIVNEPEHYVFSSASNYVYGSGVLDVDLLDGIWNDVGYINMGP